MIDRGIINQGGSDLKEISFSFSYINDIYGRYNLLLNIILL